MPPDEGGLGIPPESEAKHSAREREPKYTASEREPEHTTRERVTEPTASGRTRESTASKPEPTTTPPRPTKSQPTSAGVATQTPSLASKPWIYIETYTTEPDKSIPATATIVPLGQPKPAPAAGPHETHKRSLADKTLLERRPEPDVHMPELQKRNIRKGNCFNTDPSEKPVGERLAVPRQLLYRSLKKLCKTHKLGNRRLFYLSANELQGSQPVSSAPVNSVGCAGGMRPYIYIIPSFVRFVRADCMMLMNGCACVWI